MENAVGRSGVNINLASKLTGFTIDAYTKSEYDELLINQKTTLESLDGIKKNISKKLNNLDIVSVADYLGAQKSVLTNDLDLSQEDIDSISDAVNNFINTTHNTEKEEEVVDIDAITADIEVAIEEKANEAEDNETEENIEESIEEEVEDVTTAQEEENDEKSVKNDSENIEDDKEE